LVPGDIPPLVRQKTKAEFRDRRPSDIEDLPRDRDEQRPGSGSGGGRQSIEKDVSKAVAETAPNAKKLR